MHHQALDLMRRQVQLIFPDVAIFYRTILLQFLEVGHRAKFASKSARDALEGITGGKRIFLTHFGGKI